MKEESGKVPRLRMAPAPSGFLHLGNVRSFLFDYLYAKGHSGELVLRIEDTDADRSSPASETYLIECLHWLGIEWDEGPDIGGPYGPYRQSEREDLHTEAGKSLLDLGRAYECFCTREELEAERRDQESRNQAPRYSGKCRNLTEDQRRDLRAEGRIPSIRFLVPKGQPIGWNDLVYGEITFQSEDIGDFVILRPNGAPIYNLANVVDDHGMQITIALRGQSHLPNTPRQIMLYEALGWPIPQFAHVPDVLDKQGRKMGKRFGAKGVTEYRDEGYLSEAVVNYMALLGWSSPKDEEFLSMTELCEQFSFERVQRSNAAFDETRLEWFNGQYIRRLAPAELAARARPFLAEAGLIEMGEESSTTERLIEITSLAQERVRTLAEVPTMVGFFFTAPEYSMEGFAIKQRTPRDTAKVLGELGSRLSVIEWKDEGIVGAVDRVSEQTGWKRGEVFMALRIATTGRSVTPPLAESMIILGQEECLRRVTAAARFLNEHGGEPVA
jgi:nondiscriminating glutamyl-tRNA synthetase